MIKLRRLYVNWYKIVNFATYTFARPYLTWTPLAFRRESTSGVRSYGKLPSVTFNRSFGLILLIVLQLG